jgi:hypothetical protein
MQSASVVVNGRLPGGLPGVVGNWAGFLRLVVAEYPYCTMQGVHVVEGRVVSCEGIQRSFVFGAPEDVSPVFDMASEPGWKGLKALCEKMGSGRLAEVRFNGGRPVSARTSEGGRRFRRLLERCGTTEASPAMT